MHADNLKRMYSYTLTAEWTEHVNCKFREFVFECKVIHPSGTVPNFYILVNRSYNQ